MTRAGAVLKCLRAAGLNDLQIEQLAVRSMRDELLALPLAGQRALLPAGWLEFYNEILAAVGVD